MSKTTNWEKQLSGAAKAEMLAATFHILTDHSPDVWQMVPEWLRARIRQAMHDCSIDAHDLTAEEMKLCVKYGKWLDKKYSQRTYKRPRYLHYAIVANNWKDQTTGSSQIGCMQAENKKQATEQLYAGDDAHVERMPAKDCPVCNG